MSSKAGPVLDSNTSISGGNDTGNLNPWQQAWNTLSDKDKEQYGAPSSSMLGVLKSVCTAYSVSTTKQTIVHLADLSFVDKVQEVTESTQSEIIEKGWTIFRNKNGEKVKLRHVLEKTSRWVKDIITIIDLGVSLDPSGYASLPWQS